MHTNYYSLIQNRLFNSCPEPVRPRPGPCVQLQEDKDAICKIYNNLIPEPILLAQFWNISESPLTAVGKPQLFQIPKPQSGRAVPEHGRKETSCHYLPRWRRCRERQLLASPFRRVWKVRRGPRLQEDKQNILVKYTEKSERVAKGRRANTTLKADAKGG